MVGKNNKQVLREKQANKFKRYALKKLTVGLASVTIGTGLAFATSSTVSADELAVGERTVVVSDKTAEEQPQPDTPYLQEQEEAVTSAEEPQVTEDRISEEKAVKTSEETEEKAIESEEVAEEKQADSHEQTEETSDIEETNTKAPQAPATQLAPVAESVAKPVREEQSAEAPTTTLSQIDQLPEEFLTYLRDHSDIVDFKNAATIETYANLLQQSYGVKAAKEERIRAIEAAVKEIETTKEQAKNEVVDQTERLIDADKDSTTPQDQSKETFKKAIQQADNPQIVVESYLKDAGYKAEDIAGILANVDMSLANDPDQLLENIIQAGVKYANEHTQPGVLLANTQGRDVGHLISSKSAVEGRGVIKQSQNEGGRWFDVQARVTIDNTGDTIKAGDYFDVKYNLTSVQHLNPNENTGGEVPVVRDQEGNIVAFISDDREKGIIRYTLTSAVEERSVSGFTLKYSHHVDRAKVKETGQYNVSYTIGNQKHELKNVTIQYPRETTQSNSGRKPDNLNLKSGLVHVTDNKTYQHVTYVNPLGRQIYNGSFALFTIAPGTLDSKDATIKVYRVKDPARLSESMVGNNFNDRTIFEDVTNNPAFANLKRTRKVNNTTMVTNFVNLGTFSETYAVVVDSKNTLEDGERLDEDGGLGSGLQLKGSERANSPIITVNTSDISTVSANEVSTATSTPKPKVYSIGDRVWEDRNHDGLQSRNEPGISNVEVQLLDHKGEIIRTTRTDNDGNYLFENLSSGQYFVQFKTPDGFVPTIKNVNNNQNDTMDSDGLVVPVEINNSNNMTIDSGFYRKVYSIGDKVWVDSDKNGIQDRGERGLANVTVKLVDEFGNVKTTNTNQNGEYRFDNLDEGTYQVIFQTPEGYEATKPYQGDDRGQDSNAATTTIKVSPENPHFNEDRHNPTIDFGLVEVQPEVAEPERKVYSIGDKVWVDSNKDGVQDRGEQGLANVTVKLVDEFGNVQTTTTNRNGEYRFDNLDEGTYQVIFQTPEGYEPTKPYQGDNRNQDSNGSTTTIKVSPQNPFFNENRHNPTVDFGLIEVQPEKLYEMTVEDSSFETHIYSEEEYNKLPGKTSQTVEAGKIKKVQSGKDRRVQVLYEHVNPDTLPESTTKQFVDGFVNGTLVTEAGTFVQRNGKYWREVSRQVLQESQDEIFIYKPVSQQSPITPTFEINNDGHLIAKVEGEDSPRDLGKVKGEPGNPGKDGRDGLSPKVTVEENATDEEGNKGTRITVTPQIRNESGEIVDGTPEVSFIRDGKDGADGRDGLSPKVTVEENATDNDGNTGTRITVTPQIRNESGEIVDGTPEVSFIRDGKDGVDGQDGTDGTDGQDGKDGLSPKVTVEENATDNDGNTGTRITVTPQIRNESGEIVDGTPEVSFIRDGKDGAAGEDGADGRDGLSPKVTVEENATDEEGNKGTRITVTPQIRNESGEIVDGTPEVSFIRDGKDGAAGEDGADGRDGLSPKVTVEENATDEEGNKGTRITVTPQIRNESGEIVDGTPEVSFIRDGKDGVDGQDGTDGTDGQDGKDGLSPKVTVEENATDEEGNKGTRITVTPQIRNESGEIVDGTPEVSFIRDGKDGVDGQDGTDGQDGRDGLSPKVTVEENATDEEGNKGTRITVTPQIRNESGEIVDGTPEVSFIRDGKDGAAGEDGADGRDGLSPKVTVEENATDNDGNTGTRITVTPQIRNESGEIVDGTPEVSFIRDGKDGVDGQDGTDGQDGKDGLSPKVTVEENATDEEGNKGTRITVTPQIRNESGEIVDGTPEVSFIRDGKDGAAGEDGADGRDGLSPKVTVEENATDEEGNKGTRITVTPQIRNESGEIVDGTPEVSFIRDGKDGAAGEDGADGRDGLSPKVTVEENATDEEGNKGTRITVTPQIRNESGEIVDGTPEVSFIRDGKDGVDGQDGTDGQDGKDGLSPKVTVEENATDEEGNKGTRITVTPQIRNESGEIVDGTPEVSFIRDGKDGAAGEDGADGRDGLSPKVTVEENATDNDGNTGTRITVTPQIRNESGEIVDGTPEVSFIRDGKDGAAGEDGADGRDGLSPKVTVEENATDEEGNKGTRITVTPQIRNESGEIVDGTPEVSFIRDGKDGVDGQDGTDGTDGQDGKDGLSPKVTVEENATDEEGNKGTRITVTPQIRNESGEIVDGTPEVSFIRDGKDGVDGQDGTDGTDGQDGKDGLSPKVTVEENATDEEGNKGTRITVTPQIRNESGEIVDGTPEVSFIRDGKDGVDGQDGTDGQDGRDGLSPKVTVEENATDEEGNKGTRITVTPQIRNESGEIVDGTPEVSFIRDGKDGAAGEDGADGRDGLSPKVTVEENATDEEGNKGTRITVTPQIRNESGEIVDGTPEVSFIRDGKDGAAGEDGADGRDGLSPKVTVEENATDEEGNKGTRITVTPQIRNESGEIVDGTPEVSFIRDGKDGVDGQDGTDGTDGQDGKDGLSPKVTVEENATDEEGNKGTRITVTPQIRNESGEIVDGTPEVSFIRDGKDGVDGQDGTDGQDGRDGLSPKVTVEENATDEEGNKGTRITVTPQIRNESGEIVDGTPEVSFIRDGKDGAAGEDGADGRDGLSPKVTVEENATDNDGNTGTRITVTPQIRNESGEIVDGTPEVSFIRDGKDGVDGQDGTDGQDGKDGLSPKVTVEENATDEEGNKGTRITVTPQIRNESGEIVDGTPEVSFIRDGKDGAAGEDGADGRDGLSPKVTVEENATDEEGNKGTRITVTPQIRNESGEIVDGTPEVSFIRDGKDGAAGEDGADGRDGLSPKVTVEENATDEEGNKGTRITVTPQIRNESGEIVDGTPEVSFIRDGKDGVDGQDGTDGQDGKDGLSPKVTVEENATDEEGNKGTRITVTPQIRNESGEIVDGTPEVSFIRDGKDGAAGEDGADGRDGLSPKVTVEENATDNDGNTGTRITVTPQIRNESGEIVDGTPEVSFIRDGKDGAAGEDGADGRDGLSPKVTVEENATDEEGNKGTRITVTPQIRNESGEIVDGTPEVSFIRDGKDGVDGQDGTDGTDGQDGKDGLSPKVTVEENATDEEGNKGTRITVTPQIRNESGEIVDGTPEVSFIRDGKDGVDGQDGTDGTDGQDGKDGLSPKVTVEENATDEEGNKGTRITVTPQIRNESGEIVDGTPEVSFIRDGKDGVDGQDGTDGQDGRDGLSPKVTVEENATDEEGNKGTRITVTPQIRNESGEIVDGTPEVSFIRDGKDGAAGEDGADGRDGLSPKVTVEENATDNDGNTGTRITVTPQIRNESGEIVDGTPEVSFIRDGKDGVDGQDGTDGTDGQDGKDGLSPKVTVEENATDEEGNKGTRITVTPQIRNESGEIVDGTPEVSFIRDGKDGVDGQDGTDGQDGRDGLSPKVTVEENATDEEGNKGTRITVTPQIRNESGEIVDGTPEVSFIRDGKDGAAGEDGADGRDGLSPKVTVEENATDNDGNTGTRITVTPQIRNESGEIVDGTPEVSFIRDGKDGVDGQDGTDGQDGKDGLSPKVTVEENATDEEGNKGTRITVTPQIRNESGEIVDGTPEVSFIRDGKDGKSITVDRTETDGDGNTVVYFSDGSKVTIAKGDKGDRGEKGEPGKDGKTPTVETSNVFDADGNVTGTRIIVRDGDGNKVGDQFIPNGKNGKDGQSITASVERGEQNGRPGTYVIIRNEDGTEIDREFIFDGEKGKDGKDGNSVTASVERGEQNGRPGTYVIIRNEDGTEIDREFIFDGENGQTPTIESSNVLDADGQTVGTRIIIRDGNGRIVGDQIIRNGKDGKNGQDGKDGETPTIGSNGNWFIAGKDTGVKAKGEDGQSITITKETRDADGNTIVHFSDGSTVTISKGDKGDQGQKGDKGERGQTPNVSQTPIRDQNGRIVGYTLTFTDPVTGEKIGNSIDVYNGTDGKDGKSVTASVERGEQNGRPGSYIIIRNEDGVELDREFVFDGEEGTTPKVSVQTIERNDGRKTHVVTITNPKTGETQTFTVTDGEKGEAGQDGKDGRDGRDGRDGKNGFTPTIGSNGNWFIAGQDTGVKAKGEDGQSITVTKEVKDEQGNTVVHFSDGSTITISKGDRGETGPAGKDGRDGRDGRDGKDGKDLTGNNGNINIENSNNQSQDQNQTQNQNINQVVTNNTYNFGDVSLTINQTLNLNGEVVLTKVIVKDKDGLTNETQIDKNTQINQLNVFVNNGQVLVGTFNLTNQNNVKQLLVGNLIINLVINDNPVEPGKPAQPETTPERPSETPDNTPEQPNETPNVPSTPEETPGQPGETPETPGTNETPGNTPEQPNETPNVPSTPEETPGQPGETPETPGTNETPGNTPEQPNETPNVPSTPEETPGQPGKTPETPGTSETPDNTPEQPSETPEVPSTPEETPGQPGETPETPGTSETPDNTPEQPNETPNVPSTPGQPGETPEAPGTNETPDNTPEQPNETPNVPSTPGQPGETPETPGTNETPGNTPEQPNETPNVPSTPEETPGQPGETPEVPGTNETPNTPTQLSNTPAQPDRSSITGEQLPETATDSWMLALASLVSLSSGAVLAAKKKKDDE